MRAYEQNNVPQGSRRVINNCVLDVDLKIPVAINLPVRIPIKTKAKISFDDPLPVDAKIPISLTIPVDIPLESTSLSSYFKALGKGLRDLPKIKEAN